MFGFAFFLVLVGFVVWAYLTGRLKQWAEKVGDWLTAHLPGGD